MGLWASLGIPSSKGQTGVHRRFTDLCIENGCFLLLLFSLPERVVQWMKPSSDKDSSQGLRREPFLFCGPGILSMTLQTLVAASCPEGTRSISGCLYLTGRGSCPDIFYKLLDVSDCQLKENLNSLGLWSTEFTTETFEYSGCLRDIKSYGMDE